METFPKDRVVLVYYMNALGNGRTVRACYYSPKQLVMDDDAPMDSGEYDDATGNRYAPEGWYEQTENESPICQLEADPTHWMPLPAPPEALKER
jgi:hypothetical protein